MSEKTTCPACSNRLSSIRMAFENGDPCPVCGLPAEAAVLFEASRARGAEEEIVEVAAKAVAELATANRELERLRGVLREISHLIAEDQ